MKLAGISLLVVAAMLVAIGLLMDVTVETPSVSGGGYLPPIPSQRVANVQAMHVQGLLVQAGFVTFLAGIVLVACGAIVERLEAGASKGDAPSGHVRPAGEKRAPASPPAGSEGLTTGEWLLLGAGVAVVAIVLLIAVASGRDTPTPRFDSDAANQALSDAENTLRDLNEIDSLNR